MRARTRWNDDQFGDGNDALDRHGDCRRRVDNGQPETLLAKHLKVGSQAGDRGLRECRHFGLALVPPVRQAPLRVDVDKADGPCPRQLRLHRKMSGQGRLSGPALLRCQSQNAHAFPLPNAVNSALGVTFKALKSG